MPKKRRQASGSSSEDDVDDMPPQKRNSLRSFSFAVRQQKAREEAERLLGEADEENADQDLVFPHMHGRTWTHNGEPRAPDPHAGLPVYKTIHKIRREVLACIG